MELTKSSHVVNFRGGHRVMHDVGDVMLLDYQRFSREPVIVPNHAVVSG